MIENQNKELLTIVSPAYNEAENLDELYSRILNATENLNLEIEIIYVNDGSNDNTIEVINRQSENDGRITVIDLSRNFGKEIALTAGLDHASGDGVIVIDSDLQDPPEVIPQLVEKWRDGNDVVNAKCCLVVIRLDELLLSIALLSFSNTDSTFFFSASIFLCDTFRYSIPS